MELAAITFPRVLSAVGSRAAAFLVAKASIMLVPNVTIVMAVTSSLRPTRHPNILAKSLNKKSWRVVNKSTKTTSPDQRCHKADVDKWHEEGWPASIEAGWRTRGEQDLEAECEEVHEPVKSLSSLQLATVWLHVILRRKPDLQSLLISLDESTPDWIWHWWK